MSVEVHKVSTADSPLQKSEGICNSDVEPADSVSMIDVKQEPKEENEMKSFAQTTMNELLGLYGYEHVAEAELNRYGSSSMNTSHNGSNHGSEEDSLSPTNHEHRRESTQKQADRRKRFDRRTQVAALAKMMDTATSKRLMKSMAFASNQHTSNESLLSTNSTSSPIQGAYEDEILCSWCRKPGRSALTLQENEESKTFCSEKCFAACRRAKFKRTRVCDWCKQVRQVREYLENSQSDGRLQFCSAECLENYKMAVFCSEINNTDKNKNDRSTPQNQSPRDDNPAGKKRNPSADLMDLRMRTSPSSESTEDSRSYGETFAVKSGPSSKNSVSSNMKAKSTKTRDSEKSQSRGKGLHSERLATKRHAVDVSSGRRIVNSPRPSKEKSGYQLGKNAYLMGNKTPVNGKNEGPFYPQWTPEQSRMDTSATPPSGLLDCPVKGVGINPMNFPLLTNNFVPPGFPNMHIMQNLASAGVLSCGNSANILPNLNSRFPPGTNLQNGIFPNVPDRPPNVDNFDASSFILGMLAASSNKNDLSVPATVIKSQLGNRQLTSSNSTTPASNISSISTPLNFACSNSVPQKNDSSASQSNVVTQKSVKLETKKHETGQKNNVSSLPYPMLLVPFPIPVPIPIPIPQFPVKEQQNDDKTKESGSVKTIIKNDQEEDTNSVKNDLVSEQSCSVMDLSCKSKRSSSFSSASSYCSQTKETNDEINDSCEDQPYKKAKLST